MIACPDRESDAVETRFPVGHHERGAGLHRRAGLGDVGQHLEVARISCAVNRVRTYPRRLL